MIMSAAKRFLLRFEAFRDLRDGRAQRQRREAGLELPVIPDYALDMHTADGQKKGRGRRHFFEEASRVNPEVDDRDRTYLERLMKMLDVGELKD